MSDTNHIHTDDIIVDADVHLTIDTTTRLISNQNADRVNKKLTIMQYDNRSERYSFDIDRVIDGHDLTLCNRVQIHFNNIGSNKQKNIGLYTVDDVHINESDNNKISFSWLISSNATQLVGALSFLVSFECVADDGQTILYRWSSAIFSDIKIVNGMNNNNTIFDLYVDELLAWQNEMEQKYIPYVVDERYIERDFATSEEVAYIFECSLPDELHPAYLEDASVDENVLTIFRNDGSTLDFEPIGSNPNLLVNGDFRVNQRGQTIYDTDKLFTVDAWKLVYGSLAVNSDGSVTHTSTNTWQGIRQYVINPSRLAGKTVTFSMRANSTSTRLAQINLTKSGATSSTILGTSNTIQTGESITRFTATIPSDVTDDDSLFILLYTPQANQSVTYYWTKLEVGSVATPFIPRPYEEELADCQVIEGGFATTYSNSNMITNSDFKINQRGDLTYPSLQAGMYTVDCWVSSYQTLTVDVLDKGVRLTSSTGSFGILCQYVKANISAGTPLALSIKVNGVIYSATGVAPDVDNTSYFCSSKYARVRWHPSNLAWQVEILTGTGASIDVEWIKFEIGSVVTAYSPKTYEQELADCQNFWVRGISTTYSNPNLLINGDFRVNQRGQSEYNNTNAPTNKYTVDRWIHYINGNYTLTQNSGGGITVVNNSSTNIDFAQFIENGYELLNNKTVTLSTRINGSIWSVSATVTNNGTVYSTGIWDNGVRRGTLCIQCMTNNRYKVYFQVLGGNTFVIDYIKLELGSVATAFIPRPYAEELALCQSCGCIIDATNDIKVVSTHAYQGTDTEGYRTYSNVIVPLPQPLRAVPKVSFALDSSDSFWLIFAVGTTTFTCDDPSTLTISDIRITDCQLEFTLVTNDSSSSYTQSYIDELILMSGKLIIDAEIY